MIKKYDAKVIEPAILEFWQENKIYEKAKERNKGKKQFYFLDGPPYTSGKVHLGTAWNKALKDCFLRYKRMAGFDVWDRAGYDMHGMPTEQGVEKELGIKNKDEIEKIGVAKFVKACEEFSKKNLKLMTEDFKRIGTWMDFDNPYQTMSKEWFEGEWWLIKKAHENKRLYEGEKTMHWCAKCGTALAKHELEYAEVTEDSIFVKFPLRDKKNEFLIIWTTTPWTIPYNLGVMVNPDLDYVRAKVDDEVWIIAKQLANIMISSVDKKFKIIEEFKGEGLEGVKYWHPFRNEIKDYEKLEKKHPKVHSVVLSTEYVDTSAGSGLVHMAPGCGPEDYEVGYRNNIPPYNNLSEEGIFPESTGKFAGLKAKKDDEEFIKALEEEKALISTSKVEHDYAHCWRCKQPVIYRTTKQWFFKVEDLKDKMRELNKEIKWVPDFAGSRSFDSWLANLRDNGITRQRYWGTPLPIWKCDKCKDYVVVGSIKELKKLAGKLPEDLHKPWIDEVAIKCKCGGVKKRSPDILDVWIDSGSASWNCLRYPIKDDMFKKLYPADFILEGIDQIRGWFNLLFVASMVAMEKPSYKAVYMHGFINDALGRKMSKSLGNYILPQEVVDQYGADTLRYYMIGGTKPGVDINYNFEDMKIKNRHLFVLWNLQNYVLDLASNLNINPSELRLGKTSIEEKYILSKLNSTIRKVTKVFEEYRLNEVPWLAEDLLLELSRTYIQLTREKSSVGNDEDKKTVLYVVHNVLINILKIFTPVAPFITESIYQNFREKFKLEQESINLFDWPSYDEGFIDKELELSMEAASSIIQTILSLRDKIKLGVRWPLREVIIVTKDEKTVNAVQKLRDIVKKQTNIKEISIQQSMPEISVKVKADFSQIGPDFSDLAPKIVAKIATESPESILSKIEKSGKYPMKIDGKEVNIVKEHLIVQRTVPMPYEEAEFKNGFVYVDKELTDELEAEGFAREVMRRVQALRKNAGLEKKDRIILFVKVDNELNEMLKDWEKQIAEKVGAEKIKISNLNPSKKHAHFKKDKVKDKEIEIWFDKV